MTLRVAMSERKVCQMVASHNRMPKKSRIEFIMLIDDEIKRLKYLMVELERRTLGDYQAFKAVRYLKPYVLKLAGALTIVRASVDLTIPEENPDEPNE